MYSAKLFRHLFFYSTVVDSNHVPPEVFMLTTLEIVYIYMRDFDIEELQDFLGKKNVNFKTDGEE